jgi:hypothetical protein
MRRFTAILTALTLIAAGCRSPGNPPHHPSQGEYQDLIRREIDSASSALATSQLILRYLQTDRVPHTYAAVVLRQAANDLRKVAQDLHQIQPPPRAAHAQAQLLALLQHDNHLLTRLHNQLANHTQQKHTRSIITKHSNLIDQHLRKQLDPA